MTPVDHLVISFRTLDVRAALKPGERWPSLSHESLPHHLLSDPNLVLGAPRRLGPLPCAGASCWCRAGPVRPEHGPGFALDLVRESDRRAGRRRQGGEQAGRGTQGIRQPEHQARRNRAVVRHPRHGDDSARVDDDDSAPRCVGAGRLRAPRVVGWTGTPQRRMPDRQLFRHGPRQSDAVPVGGSFGERQRHERLAADAVCAAGPDHLLQREHQERVSLLPGGLHAWATARTYRYLDAAEVAEQKKAAAAKAAKAAGAKK